MQGGSEMLANTLSPSVQCSNTVLNIFSEPVSHPERDVGVCVFVWMCELTWTGSNLELCKGCRGVHARSRR